MPYWSRFFRLIATGSVVLFMVCVVLGAVLGTIIYRITIVSVVYGGFDGFCKNIVLILIMQLLRKMSELFFLLLQL